MSKPAELINAVLLLESWLTAEEKRFNAYLEPHRKKRDELKTQLQEWLIENESKSFSCEHGTAYLSTIKTPSIQGDKTEFLGWILEDWNARGGMLQIGAPQKDAVREYMDLNDGRLPPQVTQSAITRVNIRRG